MPLRSKLILFAVVMLLLFTGLSAGSYLSLAAASRDAEQAREELARLSLVEALERSCAGVSESTDLAGCERACRALDELKGKEWPPGAREKLDRVVALSRALVSGEVAPDLGELRAGVADLKSWTLRKVEADLRSAEEPTERRGVRLLAAAVLVALGGSAAFGWLYSRLVRERRGLEKRLRRSEKLAALGTLAAGVAHEINNPLATISMSAQALSERLRDHPEAAGFLEAIEEESARCRDIVGGLSDLARGGILDREPVDPEMLVKDALRIIGRNDDLPAAAVRTSVPPGMPLVSADRGKLLQVLVNLLRNGVEAAGAKGRVLLVASQKEGFLSLAVTDDGKGIEPARIDRIFEPFYSEKEGGVGLGLTLCHRIAELHGGELTVSSPGRGRGSTFRLTVPLEACDEE